METSILQFVAYCFQFGILIILFVILKYRIERIERAKCRCCSQSHPLLDPSNP